jgi:phosphopantetheine adenylyltransferase/uncharacterized protein (UPF0218 family)
MLYNLTTTYKYKHGVLGGTFDHLHLGHKRLLDIAFTLSKKVTIGLATEDLYKQKFLANLIEDYNTRENQLKKYLKEKNYISRADVNPLKDIFGPTLEKNDINAIFVTQTTFPNASIINEERNKKGLPALEIITVPFVKDETGEVITSEKIRLGEIDREGHVYMNMFKDKKKLKLPTNLREKLRHPIGKALTDINKINECITKQSLLISVGDIVTKSLKEIHCEPDIAIIDLKTRRQVMDKNLLEEYKKKEKRMYANEAGTIQKEVVNVYKKAIKNNIENQKKQTIIIDGEEDLLTLPAILLAPLHSIVCYGQFDLNALILVEVTEEKKNFVSGLLQQFE